MPIEIGPDGSVIVVPSLSTDDFVASIPVTTTIPTIPPDAVTAKEIKSTPVGMDKRIEESKLFNESLLNSSTKKIEEKKTEQPVINKDVILMSILKNYGMDSQQQGKAFIEIKSLMGQ